MMFLNGITFYEGDLKKELQTWIHEGKTLEKKKFFTELQTIRGGQSNPLSGTMLEQLFAKNV